jgi:YggT family protein
LFLAYLLNAVYWLLNLLSILIVIRALISWLPLGQGNKINNFLIMMTEPVIAPIRKLLSRLSFTREMPVDFSPMVAIIALGILSGLIMLLV